MQQKRVRAWLAGLALCSPLALANPLDKALTDTQTLSQAAQQSQQQIDQLDSATQSALNDYRKTLKQIQSLTAYNQQLEDLLKAQQQEQSTHAQQLADLAAAEEFVTPHLQHMLQVLEQFVAADLPFLPQERQERITHLQQLVARADVSLAEKYRRVLEAYQIESDYGRTLEAWRGELQQGTEEKTVEFLRVGRSMLYYQTADGHTSGWWNRQKQSWEELPSSARRPLTAALGIARQQKSPDWLMLPVTTLATQGDQP